LFSAQGGSTVTIVFAIAGYFAIVGMVVRFIQFSHKRDQAMRLMTTGWIEHESGALE
jgi:Na+/proline symporter